MSIELIQGFTGAGKSTWGMKRIEEQLKEGGLIGANFRLKKDFAYIIALKDKRVRRGEVSLLEAAQSIYDRSFLTGTVETIEELASPHLLDLCEAYARRRPERKALVIFDEAQIYMNSKDWRQNFPWFELFTQHRKLKLDIVLLAHHISTIDSNARTLVSFVSRAINLHEEVRLLHLRFPWPFFILQTRHKLGGRPNFQFARYSQRTADLYDSFEVFSSEELTSCLQKQGQVDQESLEEFLLDQRPWLLKDPVFVKAGEDLRLRRQKAEKRFEAWPSREENREWLNFLEGCDA